MNEFEFIARIRAQAESRESPPELVRAIGDDAAVLKQVSGRETVITTDLLVEDVDFHRDTTPPRLLGHKALAVSLSDIAAMGARPRWALCSVGVPTELWESSFLDEFYGGLFSLADRYDVKLIGGDISRATEKFVVDSIVLGECEKRPPLFRSGAQVGDRLFVTGSLGAASAGLRLLERGARINKPTKDHEWPSIEGLLIRQLAPEPRVGWGLVLGQEHLATAMIDLSDGLSSDLHHLCEESGVGALIRSAKLPVDPLVIELCGRRALDPLMLALHGGEDFELLFTVASETVARLPRKVDGIEITEIGEITSQKVLISEGSRVWNLQPEGWKHF
jgi:thiamine-monophosphate kinase